MRPVHSSNAFSVFITFLVLTSLAVPGAGADPVAFTFVKIAETNVTLMPGGGTIQDFGVLSVSDGVVAFTGGNRLQSGIFTRSVADPTSLAARFLIGDLVPGGVLRGVEGVSFHHGKFSFAGYAAPDLVSCCVFTRGIYTDTRGALELVADTNTAIPGGAGSFTQFSHAWLYDDVVVFRALGQNNQDGIYAWSDGVLRRIADTTTSVPGGSSQFVNFGFVLNDPFGSLLFGWPVSADGIVLFQGSGSNGEKGIYKEVNNSLEVVADLTTPIPGGTGNFTGFDDSLTAGNTDDGVIVFVGKGSISPGGVFPQRGIYRSDGISLTAIIDEHTLEPGSAGHFTSAGGQGIGLDDGNVVFLGDSTSAPQGIYTTLGGAVKKVVANFDLLDGEVSSVFGTYWESISGNVIGLRTAHYGPAGHFATFVAVAQPRITITTAASDSEAGSGWYNGASSGTDGVEVQVSATSGAGITSLSCLDGSTEVLSVSTDSGSFVLGDGIHSITCTATDGVGGTGVGPGSTPMPVAFQIDQEAPAIAPPANLTISQLIPTGAVATYAAPAITETGSGIATSSCVPVSGSVFAVGATTVTCTATDLAGNIGTATFSVTVTPSPDGRMFGVGHIGKRQPHHNFVFRVSQLRNADNGRLEYWVNGPRACPGSDDDGGSDSSYDGDHDRDFGRQHCNPPNHFESTLVSGVVFSGDPTSHSARFQGTGRWNGRSGYTFEAFATDLGQRRLPRDTFSMVIRDPSGSEIANISGALEGGNIQWLSLGR